MACTLIINPGSSSKKYAIYQNDTEVLRVLVSKEVAAISYDVRRNGSWIERSQIEASQYDSAVAQVLETAVNYGVIDGATEVDVIGIRLVAPGVRFQQHQLFDEELAEELRARVATAPLHIPPVLHERKVVADILPELPVVAVSDSAYHRTMPEVARRYSISSTLTKEAQVRRYGYHGLSVASVVRRSPQLLGSTVSRMVVCHIGSGVSMTAVQNGVSIDTTMGYAPGSGLVMASRSGDLDAGALLELMRVKQWDVLTAQHYLQTEGGIKAMVGESDLRHLIEKSNSGDETARAAFDLFAYRIRTQIGAMIAALGGVDALVCTATAGSRSPELRSHILTPLTGFGITVDQEKNDEAIEKAMVISQQDAPVMVAVVPTDELGEMSRITLDVWRSVADRE